MKSKRGGIREGAGRKSSSLDPRKNVSGRVQPELYTKMLMTGKAMSNLVDDALVAYFKPRPEVEVYTWLSLLDVLPPDNEDKFIYSSKTGYFEVQDGKFLNDCCGLSESMGLGRPSVIWTPYTDKLFVSLSLLGLIIKEYEDGTSNG